MRVLTFVHFQVYLTQCVVYILRAICCTLHAFNTAISGIGSRERSIGGAFHLQERQVERRRGPPQRARSRPWEMDRPLRGWDRRPWRASYVRNCRELDRTAKERKREIWATGQPGETWQKPKENETRGIFDLLRTCCSQLIIHNNIYEVYFEFWIYLL